MDIYCDYCGTRIDPTVHRNCPNCGASFSTDAELAAIKQRQNELDAIEAEKKRLELERMRLENNQINQVQNNNNVNKLNGNGCLLILLPLAIFGIFFILMIVCIIFDSSEKDSGYKMPEGTISTHRVEVTYDISLDPIKIPEMPDINIPEIKIPDINITDNP